MNLPDGEPLDFRACGKTCTPSKRITAHDGFWLDTQAPGRKFGGCCSFERMPARAIEDGLRDDAKMSINVARTKLGGPTQ